MHSLTPFAACKAIPTGGRRWANLDATGQLDNFLAWKSLNDTRPCIDRRSSALAATTAFGRPDESISPVVATVVRPVSPSVAKNTERKSGRSPIAGDRPTSHLYFTVRIR